jgi:hypothetical protein
MLTALLRIRCEVFQVTSDDLTITIKYLTTQNRIYLDRSSSECSGGYREGETPGPIPNPEAKTLFAHNTASFRCGNVGRRLASGLIFIQINSSLYTIYFNQSIQTENIVAFPLTKSIKNLIFRLNDEITLMSQYCYKMSTHVIKNVKNFIFPFLISRFIHNTPLLSES